MKIKNTQKSATLNGKIACKKCYQKKTKLSHMQKVLPLIKYQRSLTSYQSDVSAPQKIVTA